jgi:hypothetical protein
MFQKIVRNFIVAPQHARDFFPSFQWVASVLSGRAKRLKFRSWQFFVVWHNIYPIGGILFVATENVNVYSSTVPVVADAILCNYLRLAKTHKKLFRG